MPAFLLTNLGDTQMSKTVGDKVPQVTFKYRVRTDGQPITYVDTTNGGENPFVFKDVTTDDIFAGKKVIVFSLPGAFTPTCSTRQVPGFEEMYEDFKRKGIDEIYVLSVNDTFVMRQWMIWAGVEKLKFIPDGNGDFTHEMGMLIDMSSVGFANRSRRYAMIVNDGVIETLHVEPERSANNPDPYGESSPENVITYC